MISVFDIEVYKNCFTCTFKNIETLEVRSFVLSPWQNEWGLFKDYFLRHSGLIGYNNVDFDYRVVHPWLESETPPTTLDLYRRAQAVIAEDFDEKRVVPLVPQRDLFRVHHFNNKARMVSLKYLQFNMGWRNMMESPIDWQAEVKEGDVPVILEYNLNDVESTFEFYNRSKDKIRLRSKLGETYSVNMGNFSDNKIGETIFLKEMAKRTKRSEKSISQGRSPRKNIPVRDFLLPHIAFETKEFKGILSAYQKLVITNTKKAKKDKMFSVLDNVKYEFGMGGLHALRGPGIYTNIASADVSSYYPNLAIGHRIYPNHLGTVFCDVYKHIYDERKKFKKGSDEDVAFKAALVCVFGSSNAPWSPFYDPRYTMSITINGQLILAMLCEQITLRGAGHILMANTDGIELEIINESVFREVCSAWQQANNLLLEYATYKQIAIRDVNAYHAIKVGGDVKTKGDFEIKKEIYKDSSMRIVPIAVDKYFREGVPVEKTINECEDISLFVIGKRAKKGRLEYRHVIGGKLVREAVPKNVRFYISRSGGSLVKITKATDKQKKKVVKVDNQSELFTVKTVKREDEQRVTALYKGYRMTLFNRWVDCPFKDYNIEKQFYIREANKLINSVVQQQTI